MKLVKPCPKCGGTDIHIMQQVARKPTKKHCFCLSCFHAGKGSRFGFLARLKWNIQKNET